LLASILVEWGIVSESQVEQGRARQRVTGGRLGEALVDLGFATEESIGRTLAKALGAPFTSVDLTAVDPAVVNRFHVGVLRRALAMPLIDSGGQIVVAMADPTDRAAVAELRAGAGAPISIVVGAPSAIRRALSEYLGVDAGETDDPADSHSIPTPVTSRVDPPRADPPRIDAPRAEVVGADPLPAESPRANGPHAGAPRYRPDGATLLTRYLEGAHALRASEIHIVPSVSSAAIYYRTDRGLEAHGAEPADAAPAIRAALTALGVPDLAGDGETAAQAWGALTLGQGRVQFRVSHCRGDAGVSTVLRLGPTLPEAPHVSTLGLTPLAEAELCELVEGPEGIVIVYGPPHSGGSTVLASLASLAAREDRRLLVLEPSPAAPYPECATRIRFGERAEAARLWSSLLLGQGADVMVLDDVLHGGAIETVLSGATVGRLVFARTDWIDGQELLQCLSRSRHARVALRDRPFVMIELPSARRDGSAVWAPAEAGGLSPGTLHSTLLTNEERDALTGGR
jgi:type IV pilus assembly protein PilB